VVFSQPTSYPRHVRGILLTEAIKKVLFFRDDKQTLHVVGRTYGGEGVLTVGVAGQTSDPKLEVLVNRADSIGEIREGMTIAADVWLQGYILSDRELRLRYEGVDLEAPTKLFWSALRREH